MIIFTPVFETTPKKEVQIPKFDGLKMNLEEFLNFNFEDSSFKYEWNNGTTEAVEKMKIKERIIYRNINRKFIQTSAFQKGYELIAEADCFFRKLNKLRRPDICIFSKEQILKPDLSKDAPELIIEILSPNNSIIEEESKIHEYFQAGCKVVWHIYPSIQKVKVYYSPKQIKICTDKDICDGGSAITDFQISVEEIFLDNN